MKFAKLFLVSVVIFFIIITAISLLIPSHVRISRAVNIAPDNDTILMKICNLEQWKNWHPQLANSALKDIITEHGQIKQASANGTVLSVEKCSDSEVIVKMLKGARRLQNHWILIKHNPDDSLILQNYIDFNFSWYPWEKFSSLMLESSYGHVMEKALQNLARNTNEK